MKVGRILRLTVKTVAVVLLLAAFAAVAYSFGQKGGQARNDGATVTLTGKVGEVEKDELLLTTIETPFGSEIERAGGAIARVKITNETRFSKTMIEEGENGKAKAASAPKKITYSEIRKGEIVAILAKIVSNGELEAKRVLVVPSTARGKALGRKPSRKEDLKNMKTVDGIVKEVGDKRFVVKITTGTTVTILVDEQTSYMRGVAGPGQKSKESSFSEVKQGARVVVGGTEDSGEAIMAKTVFIVEGERR